MKTMANDRKRVRSWVVALSAGGAALAAALAACGGSVGQTVISGSESHFLVSCSDHCGDNLTCIGGICTRACRVAEDSCTDLTPSALCTNESVEPGAVAVCDVPCVGAEDCSDLGRGARCSAGFCRPERAATTPGASGGNPNVDCRPVGRYQVGKEGGYLPCCLGLTELSTGFESGPDDARTCFSPPLNSYSCIQGTCGDGVCEAEEAPCGCGVDCPESNWRSSEAECAPYLDASIPPVEYFVEIANVGTTVLYLEPSFIDCLVPTSLVSVERNGERVNMMGGGCAQSCQLAYNEGWTVSTEGGDSVACPAECFEPAPVEIQPGQTLRQTQGLEVAFQRMPRGCAEGITSEAVNCYSRVVPEPGTYSFGVRAFRELECLDPVGDCSCGPDETGACTNRQLRVTGEALSVSTESDNYFADIRLEISG